MRSTLTRGTAIARQRGAATLIIVMVLFFIVALTAAYTSRNMIFEQKTSANQYRSTQAFEAAEAGLEWALTMLASGRLDDATCLAAAPLTTPPAATVLTSFTQRYLTLDAADGTVRATNPARSGKLLPTCVFTGSAWTCNCPPTMLDPATTPESGYTGPQPAFRVRLLAYDPANPASTLNPPNEPGLVRIEAMGCTRYDEGCLNFGTTALSGEGVAVVSTLVALRNGLAMPPTAAITARGTVTRDPTTATIAVSNTVEGGSGITAQTGAALSAASRASLIATSVPGTPGSLSLIESDTALAALTTTVHPDRMFAAVFGMRRLAYRQQPGLRECADPCNAASVNALLANNPHRAIWVAGDLTVDGNIGNANDPAVLVVEGEVKVTGGGGTLVGVVFLSDDDAEIDADTGAALTLQGALVAERDLEVSGGGSVSVQYDATTLARLRSTYGSFVRLPGGWHDWVGP